MATFNTAFGSLPKPQEQYGTGGARRTRQDSTMPWQRAGGAPKPERTKTFAQLQQDGEARPAPPQAQPAPAQPLMQRLNTTLGVSSDNQQSQAAAGGGWSDEDALMPQFPYGPGGPAGPKPPPPAPPKPPGEGPDDVMPGGPGTTWGGGTQPGGFSPSQPNPEGYTPGTFTPTATAPQDVQGLQELLQQMLSQPSRFDDEVFNQVRSANKANLDAEFGGARQALEEDMARRGISASSIAAGRYGDLSGQQARAMATMDADLLKEMATTQAQDRALAAQSGTDLQRLLDSRAQFGQDLELRAFQVQEQARQAGRELTLQEARDIAQREQFSQDMSLRETLGLGQLDVDRRRADNEARLANNNMFMSLAQVLSGMTPEQFNTWMSSKGMGGGAGGGGGGGGDSGAVGGPPFPQNLPPQRKGTPGEVVDGWRYVDDKTGWVPA
jgi:hypothetical protein